jgi:hypothetical protein
MAGSLGDVDLITYEDVRGLGSIDGPCVSLLMRTHRFGPDTRQGPVRLRNLVEAAGRELGANGSVADAVLEPIRALESDGDFWQHQADGLAVFAAAGFHRTVRLPFEVADAATVAPWFRVVPLLGAVEPFGPFLVLAVSEKSVRLFEATRSNIVELDLGPIPPSRAAALAHEDPERQLQMRTGGPGVASFHGHGAGDEVDKAALERFLRAVDRGLSERVGGGDVPLVLACVGYYHALFRSITTYPRLLDQVVEGNPDRRSPDDLHAAAWEVVSPLVEAERRKIADRYRAVAGTGATVTQIEPLLECAHDGRVEALLVARGAPPVWGVGVGSAGTSTERAPMQGDLLDLAVHATLARGGRVELVEEIEPGVAVAALLRY